MAETPKDGLFKRIGRGFDRYIGGLLGEDLEGMSPEERAAARRSVIGIIGRGMVDPSQGSEALGAVTQARAMQRAQAEVARRTATAEAEMPRIAGRLFGGSAGMIETLPGQPEEETQLMTSRYRVDPQDAMARLYGTQEGRDVATMAPDLAKLASEGVTGRTVGGAVYNPLTGAFSRPPEAPKPRVQVGRVDLTDRVIVSYSDGTEQTFMKGAAAGARAAGGGGGGGGAPRAAGAPGAPSRGERFQTLTAEETVTAGFPEGTVVQRDSQTNALKVLSAVPATQRASEAGKATSVTRVENIVGRIIGQMDNVKTGGILGGTGAMSSVFDSQDAKLFQTYREQLSTALRAALRIPGEGPLSDRDLAQYGLTLPSLGQSRENNLAILESLQEQVRLAAGQDIQQVPGPRAGAAGGPPPAAAPAAPAAPQYIYRNGRLVPAQPR
jgi:hypothetical protein